MGQVVEHIAEEWRFYVPGSVILIAGYFVVRWLMKHEDRLDEHGERIAHLEGHDERD